MNVKKYLAKGTFFGLVNTFFSAFFAIAFIPVLVRIMGMDVYGSWSLLAIFSGFAGTMDLGLAKSLVYFTTGKDKNDNAEIYAAALVINICLVALAGLALSCIWVFDIMLFPEGSVSRELQLHLIICGSTILLSILATSFWMAVLESAYKIHWNNIISCAQTCLLYAGIAAVYYLTSDLVATLYYTAAVYFSILLTSIVLASRHITFRFKSLCIGTFKKIISYSIRMYAIGLLWACIVPANRLLFVRLGGDMATYAMFDIAMKIASASLACLNAFSSPLYALFSGWGFEQFQRIKQTLSKRLRLMTALYLGGLLVFIVFGKVILALLIPETSDTLYYISAIMIAGLGCYGPGEPYVRAFWGLGDINTAFKIQLIAPVINFAIIAALYSTPVAYRISIAYAAGWLVSGLAFIIIFNIKYRAAKT